MFSVLSFFLGFKAAAKFATVPSHHTKPNQVSTNKKSLLSSTFSLTLSYTYGSSLSLSCTTLLYNNKPRLKPLVCRARLINLRILCSYFVSEAYFVESWIFQQPDFFIDSIVGIKFIWCFTNIYDSFIWYFELWKYFCYCLWFYLSLLFVNVRSIYY